MLRYLHHFVFNVVLPVYGRHILKELLLFVNLLLPLMIFWNDVGNSIPYKIITKKD